MKHPVPASVRNIQCQCLHFLAVPQEEAGRQGPQVSGLGLFGVSLATPEPLQHPWEGFLSLGKRRVILGKEEEMGARARM